MKKKVETTTRQFGGKKINFKFEFVRFTTVADAVTYEGADSVLRIINAAMKHKGINLETSRIRRHLEKQTKVEADGLIS